MLTLSLMQQQSATERLRGVSWSGPDRSAGHRGRVGAARHAAARPERQRAARRVDALRRFSDRPDVRLGTNGPSPSSSSPLLQVAVIDFMVETRNPQAPALFKTLAQDTSLDESVRGRAQWALEQFAS